MAKDIMEKQKNRKRTPSAMVGTTRRHNTKPKDRITAIVMAAEAAGYGPHYGKFVADHPDAFKDWEPGQELPKVDPNVYEVTCAGCGKTFITRNKRQKYCDDLCRGRKACADYRARKEQREENAK